jgi:hypothetical protein
VGGGVGGGPRGLTGGLGPLISSNQPQIRISQSLTMKRFRCDSTHQIRRLDIYRSVEVVDQYFEFE